MVQNIRTIDGTNIQRSTWRRPTIIIRPNLTAFCTTVAIFASAGAAAHGPGEIVMPNFEQTIPNLAAKSLIAV
jgi:hypothetical protein